MLKKLARSAALGTIAAVAGAAGAGVGAFALYAALKDPLGQAGAAAVVALLFLIVAGIAVAIMRGGGDKDAQAPQHNPISDASNKVAVVRERAMTLVQQRPLAAGAVGLVGALFLLRNPALVSAVVAGLVGRAEGKMEQRRRGWF
jgi:hypothetical protein